MTDKEQLDAIYEAVIHNPSGTALLLRMQRTELLLEEHRAQLVEHDKLLGSLITATTEQTGATKKLTRIGTVVATVVTLLMALLTLMLSHPTMHSYLYLLSDRTSVYADSETSIPSIRK